MHMWKVFSEAYPRYFPEVCPYFCFTINTHKDPVSDYFRLLESEKLCWRAILSVSTNILEISDLVAIGSMHNLAALEINKIGRLDPDRGDWARKGGMTDSVVRSWVDMALKDKTLQHLRVLKFRNQDRLTPHCLAYLSELPELQFVITQNCSGFTNVVAPLCALRPDRPHDQENFNPRVHGWIARTLENVILMDNRGHDILSPIIKLYTYTPNESFNSFKDMEPLRASSLAVSVPVLEFQLPINERRVYNIDMQRGKYRDVCCFVRGKSTPNTLKRDAEKSADMSRPQKRIMKQRKDGLDLAQMLDGLW
ncbi:hypothetical protein N7470_003629 [Penicillium chermesinum]|nr:hypothetical protein N7470_003629 [Penicillium chermesinum]